MTPAGEKAEGYGWEVRMGEVPKSVASLRVKLCSNVVMVAGA